MSAAVSHIDALDDGDWFMSRRQRRYRARFGSDGAIWLVRRKGRVYLRVRSDLRNMPVDVESAIESLWWRAVWPELPPKARQTLMRESRPPSPTSSRSAG